jgi:hypothetical protein
MAFSSIPAITPGERSAVKWYSRHQMRRSNWNRSYGKNAL